MWRFLIPTVFFLLFIITNFTVNATILNTDNAEKLVEKTTWAFNKNSITLYGPDNSEKPIAWEGPIKISTTNKSCSFDLGIIYRLEKIKNNLFVLSYSGNIKYLDLINLNKCKQIGKQLTLFAKEIKINNQKIYSYPQCETIKENSYLCSSATIYEWNNNTINNLINESKALTKNILGVKFLGKKIIEKKSIKKGYLDDK